MTPQHLLLAMLLTSTLLACEDAHTPSPTSPQIQTPPVLDTRPTPTPPEPPPTQDAATDAQIAKGKALVESFECGRCHEGLDTSPVARDKHCVKCHQDILAGRFKAPSEALEGWRKSIRSLLHVPRLDEVGARFERRWLVRFLQAPQDLRPALGATMPRLDIDATQAEAIAAFLAPQAAPARHTLTGDAQRGQSLMTALGCGFCHRFTGAPPLPARKPAIDIPDDTLARAMVLAPDLRWTRDRFRTDSLQAWLQDPRALKPNTPMPSFDLNAEDARDIAAWLLGAPLKPTEPTPRPERLPVLDRKVTYDEVEARVFKKICWHCHAEPDFAKGDGGPGNTGGFGFSPRGLNLASYTATASGILNAKGERQSLFGAFDGETPYLVAVLLARQAEEAGAPVSGLRGMPLGLPSLSPRDIQLVESWIAQGRPR